MFKILLTKYGFTVGLLTVVYSYCHCSSVKLHSGLETVNSSSSLGTAVTYCAMNRKCWRSLMPQWPDTI